MSSKKVEKNAIDLEIQGGRKLHGSIETNTSKNGAVALLCASLLNEGTTTFRQMPKIEEVNRIIEVLQSIGVSVTWKSHDVIIKPPKKSKGISLSKMNREAAIKTRTIIMFIGPLLHLFKSFSIPQSGGCELGTRTIRPHFEALRELGVSIKTKTNLYDISYKKLKPAEIILSESGDTATENALMAASKIKGTTIIKYASANYMVQEMCFFLEKLGVKIEGIGTTTLKVTGISKIEKDVEYNLAEDPTDTMFFLASAIVTKSSVRITRCPIDFLEVELQTLKNMGFKYKILKKYKSKNGKTNLIDIKTLPSNLIAPLDKIHARPYPGLNIDNLPFFSVIATQAKGQTLIHDWTYEKRALYYTELDRLGAETTLADPHRFFVKGPTKLKSIELTCPPALRPATIILVGMLGASGTSILRNIYSINRGYENLVNRLNSLGAKVRILK